MSQFVQILRRHPSARIVVGSDEIDIRRDLAVDRHDRQSPAGRLREIPVVRLVVARHDQNAVHPVFEQPPDARLIVDLIVVVQRNQPQIIPLHQFPVQRGKEFGEKGAVNAAHNSDGSGLAGAHSVAQAVVVIAEPARHLQNPVPRGLRDLALLLDHPGHG